jgi:hypothetical protein
MAAPLLGAIPDSLRCSRPPRRVKSDFGTRVQVLFAVPRLHTVNRSPLAGQLDLSCFAAWADALGNA